MLSKHSHNLLLALVALTCLAHHATAANYYVSLLGNDADAGTEENPWQSIAKVNQTVLHPGDGVYFFEGQTFVGNITLTGGGTDREPVTIGSYGPGRDVATINTLSQTPISTVTNTPAAIYGYNTGGFIIQDLNIQGGNPCGFGISFYTDNHTGRKYPGVTIHNVAISGVQADGISFGQWTPSNPGWDFVVVTNVSSHDNGGGMSTYGYTVPGVATYAIGSIYVGQSQFYNNHGSGLVLCGAAGGVVEFCDFHDNQTPGGCWTWGTSGITIQHCVSFNNKSGGPTDGFGFDLDGGSQNCTIQYCLTYGNDTPGYVIFDYNDSAGTRNNTIRYCISENDVRSDAEWGSFEVLPYANTPIKNSSIYNCVACLTTRPNAVNVASGFEAYGRQNPSGYYSGKSIDTRFFNNIVYLNGPGSDLRLLTINDGATRRGQLRIRDNIYYSTQGNMAIYDSGIVYATFAAWRAANQNQEPLDGPDISQFANPLFTSVGTGSSIADYTMLGALTSYQPAPASPCINQALHLERKYGLNPGAFDFWENALPAHGPLTIGAFQ